MSTNQILQMYADKWEIIEIRYKSCCKFRLLIWSDACHNNMIFKKLWFGLYCLLSFSVVAIFCSFRHQYQILCTMVVLSPANTAIGIISIKQGKGNEKNRKKIYYKTEFFFCCFQPKWCDHTGCFLKNFTPYVTDEVIFPPCLWNRSTEIKL